MFGEHQMLCWSFDAYVNTQILAVVFPMPCFIKFMLSNELMTCVKLKKKEKRLNPVVFVL